MEGTSRVLLLLATYFSQSVGCAVQKLFHEEPGVYSSSDVIQRAGPASVTSCVRACRLYKECNAFNMRWSVLGETGVCELLVGGHLVGDIVLTDNSTSYFGPCRHRAGPRQPCYHVVESPQLGMDAAGDYCGQLFSGAQLVDITSQEETDFLAEILQGYPAIERYHTAGRRPDGGARNEFFWTSTGAPVRDYTNWRYGQPNEGSPDDDCLIPIRAWDWRWSDSGCGLRASFICEF